MIRGVRGDLARVAPPRTDASAALLHALAVLAVVVAHVGTIVFAMRTTILGGAFAQAERLRERGEGGREGVSGRERE